MAGKKPTVPDKESAPPPQEIKTEGEIRFSEGTPAEVKELISRGGSRGDLTQVTAMILEGRDQNKTIRRNVRGPVRLGDILILLDTEIEAQRLGGGGKKGPIKKDKRGK